MEITNYRAEARNLDGIVELDPISWWDGNSIKLPLRRNLSAPATTDDVERLFSVAGRICQPHRSRLNSKLLRSL